MRLLGTATVLLALCQSAAAAPQMSTARASEASAGAGGNSISQNARVSGNGEHVVFHGDSSNLVAGDTNGFDDVFRKDTLTGVVVRASVPTGGLLQSNGASQNPDVSQDGDRIVFESFASNLVPGDTNVRIDIFWHSVSTGTTLRASVSSGGGQSNGHSWFPACDASGDLIAFETEANNLAEIDNNFVKDIYLRDLASSTTERISLTATGIGPNKDCRLPAVSPDGNWVAFQSDATNLVPGDTNGVSDVFLKNRATGALTRVSVGTGGVQGNQPSRYPALSFDARTIAFGSKSDNWVPGTHALFDCYVHDRLSGVTTLVSKHSNGTPSNDVCTKPDISRSGRWVVFAGDASNLVQGDNNGSRDVFLHDTATGATSRVSVALAGVEANATSDLPGVSDDAARVTYESDASNLIAGDVNGQRDVFYGDLCGAPPSTYCTGKLNSAGCVPTMTSVGTPSATSSSSFDLQAGLVVNSKAGFLFYGLSPSVAPFAGGIKCVQAPTRRTPALSSGGSAPPVNDCSGVLVYDFNARIQAGVDPNLVPGTSVYTQFYYRDPPSTFTVGLTQAACFTIQP